MKRTFPHFPGSESSTRSRRGFVLVLVLVLILLATLSVAGFSRRSLELGLTVAEAQEALQRRWGIRSCRQLLLANAERLLERGTGMPPESVPWPVPSSMRGSFMLGGLEFEYLLSDEDAKVNLNALALREPNPLSRLTSAVRVSSGPAGLTPLIRWPPRKSESSELLPFRTWEQVFDLRTGASSAEQGERLQSGTAEITCWGSGKLNLRRASGQALQTVCDREVKGETLRKLLAARQRGGTQTLEALLGGLPLKVEESTALKRLLSTESRCHALWLTVRNSKRSWSSLTIDGSGEANSSLYELFVW